MAPRSDDLLWGSASSRPLPVEFSVLMPNGTLITHDFSRDATLARVKDVMWVRSKNEALFRLLRDPSSYIFRGVTIDGSSEEFYDEGKSLNELRLFSPMLVLVEPKGNVEERRYYGALSEAIGAKVDMFDAVKDHEFINCRNQLLLIAQDYHNRRKQSPAERKLDYFFPYEIEPHQNLSGSISGEFKVVVYFDPNVAVTKSVEFTVNTDNTPAELIRMVRYEVCRKYRQELPDFEAVLKVAAYDEYLLGSFPLYQYKYVSRCISNRRRPEFRLIDKGLLDAEISEAVKESDVFIFPSALRRNAANLITPSYDDVQSLKIAELWTLNGTFQLKVNFVTYANVRDTYKISVNAAIYHGEQMLGNMMSTKDIEPQNPKWNEQLDFGLNYEDIPRCARLCLSLCATHNSKRSEATMEAWVNVLLFEYNGFLKSGKHNLSLWRATKEMEGKLNSMGICGQNTDKDATCLEVEFCTTRGSVIYPTTESINLFAKHLRQSRQPKQVYSDDEKARIKELVKPFAELCEDDHDFIWNMRHFIKDAYPNSLPMLIETMKWQDRSNVTALYDMLNEWPQVQVNTALDLLDWRFPDTKVRTKAVEWLDQILPDAQLADYLLQLVHVALKESYLDNEVSKFLLRRALKNRLIGHNFFWLLKAELDDSFHNCRCELLLEAYCRGITKKLLQKITKQVVALNKLHQITNTLAECRDAPQKERLNMLQELCKSEETFTVLCDFQSPLRYSARLGDLLVDNCRIMDSAKRPLWLVWKNGEPLPADSDALHMEHAIIFKNGDDLRQDMLTLQVIRIMDSIWRSEGLDLKMMSYSCLPTAREVGMIEVVQRAKTVMHRQKESGIMAALQIGPKELHRWFKSEAKHNSEKYNKMIDNFTRSCAGYCVATYVLGIGDRNPDNIMINDDGQIFHIDFGHFLGHFKKKFGITRERVPFVLTEDFLFVICRGSEPTPEACQTFYRYCEDAYTILRRRANLLITLFTLMLSTGIPELQSPEDIGYLKTTLQVMISDDNKALNHFRSRLIQARNRSGYTRLDWLFHSIRHA